MYAAHNYVDEEMYSNVARSPLRAVTKALRSSRSPTVPARETGMAKANL
jgi:hypothetical protein